MTATSSAHPAPAAHAVADAALWFGLFGAPAAWSLQLLFNYAMVAHSCYPADNPRSTPLSGSVWSLVLVAGVVAAGLALGAGATAWRTWRGTRKEREGDHGALLETGEGRTRFMAVAGLLLSGVFLYGIVLNLVPLFLVPPCG